MSVLEDHLAELRRRHPGASASAMPSGTRLVALPGIALPPGWSKASTSVRFLAMAAYPLAPPDCFWADPDLRLADGRQPQNTALQPIPEANQPGLWFSWHIAAQWRPGRDTLTGWMGSIADRFARAC